MLDPLKKIMLAGIGAAFFTREKLEEVIQKLIQSNQLSREQGKKVLDELAEKGKTEQEALSNKFYEEISGLFKKYQPINRSEFDKLSARVKLLEEKSGAGNPEPGPVPETSESSESVDNETSEPSGSESSESSESVGIETSEPSGSESSESSESVGNETSEPDGDETSEPAGDEPSESDGDETSKPAGGNSSEPAGEN